MKKNFLILMLNFAISISLAQGKGSLTFDLADGGGSSPSIKKYVEVVHLNNAFPKRKYKLTISEEKPVESPLKDMPGGGGASDSTSCPELKDLFDNISLYVDTDDEAESEKELKQLLDALKVSMVLCDDENLKNKIKELLNLCTRTIDLVVPLEMEKSSDYIFTVEGTNEKYEYKFKGKTPGRWLLTYGFVFSSKSLEPDQYYSESLGDDSFRITKKNKTDLLDLRYTPTIFWSYFFDKNLNNNLNHSATAGLGFNTSTVVVSAGYNLMFRHNIGISLGISFYEQQKLNGKYSESQIITESLDDDQLYEKHFRPNLFFGINFRFGDNPFETKKNEPAE